MMSSFSTPSWDIDKSADILYKQFSENRKSSNSKNASKKKRQSKFAVRSEEVKDKFNRSNFNPRLKKHGQRQKEGKTKFAVRSEEVKDKFNRTNFNPRLKKHGQRQKEENIHPQVHGKMKNRNSVNRNLNEKIVAHKGKKFRRSDDVTFENRNKEMRKFVGKAQNSLKNNLINGNKKTLKPHKTSNNEHFSLKNTRKKNKLIHGKSYGENTSVGKKLPTEIVRLGFKMSGKNKNVELPNHGNDSSIHFTNKKQKNRKRSISQVSESSDNAKNFKKRKIVDASNQHKTSQKQAFQDRNYLTKNSFRKDSGNQVKENLKNNFNAQPNRTGNNKKTKKIKKSSTNFENVRSSQNSNLNSDIKEANRKGSQSPLVFKNPYSGKKRFLDSSLPLRERMLQQLKSSRFRYINEQLYTSDSKGAENMFKNDPDLFQIYHDGFKQQVEQWPLNPVDRIIKTIQKKPPNLVVADFGCGDAKIAKSLPNKVHSFDLVALSNEVTVCDMAHTPLENESVDISVFCLSLMGTNLGNYLTEANRILKIRGILKIAEVASRFDSVEKFIKDVQKYGFSLINKDLSHDLFYFLNFRKDSNVKKVKGLPTLSLNPCWYKKR